MGPWLQMTAAFTQIRNLPYLNCFRCRSDRNIFSHRYFLSTWILLLFCYMYRKAQSCAAGRTDRQTSSQDDQKTDRHTIGWRSNLIEKKVDVIVSPFYQSRNKNTITLLFSLFKFLLMVACLDFSRWLDKLILGLSWIQPVC